MDRIMGVLGNIPKSNTRYDGDLSDRLCYPYTTVLFTVFAVIVSTKQFVGDPIQCWVPAHFGGDQADYANDYCWLGNTYFLPLDSAIPREGADETEKARVSYYHWIPIILLVQALAFYFPRSIWRMLCNKSGLDVEDLVHTSETFVCLELEETRDKTMRFMIKQIDRYLSLSCGARFRQPTQRSRIGAIRQRLDRARGWYLTITYLLVKLMSLANVLAQLFLLNLFLGTGFHMYGFEVASRVFRGEDDDGMAPRFPRITMCDFKVRRLGANHRYTVQCVLPINLFNEKIFLCVWLWLVFLAAALVLSSIQWILRVLLMRSRHHYIEGHLSINPQDARSFRRVDSDKLKITRFLNWYLQYDGVFVLRLIGHNTSSLAVIELAISLWDNFKKKNLVDSDGVSSSSPE